MDFGLWNIPARTDPNGGPEPPAEEINEILGSKREDQFSNPFFELVQKKCQVRFWHLLWHGNLCKGPQTL